MNQASQAAGASAPQALPVKRKRGRPRKDQNLTRFQSTRTPPGFGTKVNQFHRVDKTDVTNGGMVGQAVTGVIEAAFDAGYLLTVRIGNSNTNLRGVVFKPGNYSPITAENDVAPHVQMIKRNEVRFPVENQLQSNNWSRESELNGSLHVNQVQGFVPQPAGVVASKGKHTSLTAVPCATAGARGNVVPVVLQPVNLVNGSPLASQTPADSSVLRDKDVVNAEPLAMLPPAGMSSTHFLICRNQQKASQLQTSLQVTPRSGQNDENGSCNEDRHEIGGRDGTKDIKLTDVPEPGEHSTGTQGSSDSLETHLDNSKSSAENSQMDLDNEICTVQTPYTPKPMKNYGTGRMTELLQALQENMDIQVAHSDGRVADSKAEHEESRNLETNCKDEAKAP